VALRIDAGLVSCLVDRFYGGTGGKNAAAGQEFTPTESRIIDRLSNQIMKALVASWADFIAMEFSLAGRETGVAQAAIAAGDADVVVHSFEVNTGDPEPYTIEVVYPLEGLQGVDIVDTSKGADEVRRTDPMWRRQLEQRMEDVRLPARSILARPNLKMSELIALKPGDVINIHLARHLPLIVGNRVFAHGTIGEQDGRAAFMIEKLA